MACNAKICAAQYTHGIRFKRKWYSPKSEVAKLHETGVLVKIAAWLAHHLQLYTLQISPPVIALSGGFFVSGDLVKYA